MADRNDYREPRWTNSGYWINRDEDDRREGDREHARTYDQRDMRRYGRASQEQGERMRAMRSQDRYQEQDYRHSGGNEGDYDWDQQDYGSRRDYDSRRDYGGETYNSEMARGRGFERYRGAEGPYGGETFGSQRYFGRRNYRADPGRKMQRRYPRYEQGERERFPGRGGYPQEEGEMGNFWGERERWRQYDEDECGRDYAHGLDFDYQIENSWDDAEIDREFDLDPGFSYEFGTDFSALNQSAIQRYDRQRNPRQERRMGYNPGSGRMSGGRRREEWEIPGEFTGIGPRGYQRSAERITEDICERLTYHGQIDARGIEIQVENNEVTLSGNVSSRQEKYLAEYLAESISGVQDVHNRIRVTSNQGVRVRGMGRENVVMAGRIQEGMRVAGVDDKHIGKVKQVRTEGFIIDRTDAGDTFIPFRAIKRTNGQIILHLAGNEIDRQGWKES